MRILFILFPLMIFISSCAHRDCGHEQLMSRYERSLQQMANQLQFEPEQDNLVIIDQVAQELTDAGTTLLMDFKQRHPKCRPLLEKIISEQGMMLTVTLEELERRYHEGEDLPTSPEYCFHAKELVVHPQTIRSLIRHQRKDGESYRQMMIEEHIELSTHFKMFEEDFKR